MSESSSLSTHSGSIRLEQTDEGIWIVFGAGKYPHDPPRPANHVEIRLWEALVKAHRQLSQIDYKGPKQIGRARSTMEKALGIEPDLVALLTNNRQTKEEQ